MCLAVMAAWGEGWDELSLEGWVGFAKASVAGRWGKPWLRIVNKPGTGVKHLGERYLLGKRKMKPVRILRGTGATSQWDHSRRVMGKALGWASLTQCRELDPEPSIVNARHKKTMTKMERVSQSKLF